MCRVRLNKIRVDGTQGMGIGLSGSVNQLICLIEHI